MNRWAKAMIVAMTVALLVCGTMQGQGIPPAKKAVIKHRGILDAEFANLGGLDPDPDKMFSSLNEMIAYDSEIFDYAVEKLQVASFLESISAAFLLGEIDTAEAPSRLLDLIKKRVMPAKKGLASPTVVTDGFLCMSLGIQGSKLVARQSAASDIVNQIRSHFRKLADKSNNYDRFVQVSALIGLGLMLDRESLPVFIEAAKDETRPSIVRVAAVMSLAYFPCEESRKALEELAAQEADMSNWLKVYIQKNAALGLGNVGSKQSIPVLMKIVAESKSPSARNHAWLSLGELGAKEQVEELRKLVLKEPDPKSVTSAVRVFYQLGDAETAFKILDRIVKNPTVSTGQLKYATQILGSLMDERVIEPLKKISQNPNVEIAQMAVANLVHWAHMDDIKKFLVHIVTTHTDPEMRKQATLGFLKWEMNMNTIKILNDVVVWAVDEEKGKVKRAIALALANREASRENVAVLKALMKDPDRMVRNYAAVAFGTTAWGLEKGEYRVLDALINDDKSPWVRKGAEMAKRCIAESDVSASKKALDRYLAHESLAAKPIWGEFWTHQFEVLLLAAAQDANVRMTTTAPGDVVVQESEAESLASFEETVEVACLG